MRRIRKSCIERDSFDSGGEIYGSGGGRIHYKQRRRDEFPPSLGRRLNGFLGVSLNDRDILFLVISLDKTVSVFALRRSPLSSYPSPLVTLFDG